MYCAGVGKGDIVQVAYGYGLFTGGLGAHYGAERVGAMVVPISGGNTVRQLMLLQDFGTTALCCTPSYALNLAEALEHDGVKETKLKVGIFGAEPWTESMRVKIESMLHIDALNIYGLSEVMGPGVSMECMCKQGMHIWEDHFLPEVIGPDNKALPYGKQGDLTFTTLSKHGMPLLRYRTHDLCTLTDAPCDCGRTHVRMGRVMGRTDDMLIIRGVNVFPSQIEHALLQVEGYRAAVPDRGGAPEHAGYAGNSSGAVSRQHERHRAGSGSAGAQHRQFRGGARARFRQDQALPARYLCPAARARLSAWWTTANYKCYNLMHGGDIAMFVKQISVFLENRSGSLAGFTKLLGDHGIDLMSLSIADTTDFGILRGIVADYQARAGAACGGRLFREDDRRHRRQHSRSSRLACRPCLLVLSRPPHRA